MVLSDIVIVLRVRLTVSELDGKRGSISEVGRR